MKKIKGSLLIIILMLFILTTNLVTTAYAKPLTRIDGSIRVENVGSGQSYKSSRLKLQKLSYINGSSEVNSIDPLNNNGVEEVLTIKTVPNKMVVDTGNKVLGSIGYEDFYLIANKITTEVGPAYCLEVEKEYPNGEMFEFEGTPEKNIIGMMAAGYPNKSAEELGVASDDAAYFATQMAIWCVTEGYVPKKFKSSDKVMLQTIKNIYEEGMQYSGEDVGHIAMEYYYSDSVQRVVAYILDRQEVIPPSGNDTVTPDEIVPDISEDTVPDITEDEEIIETPSEEESEKVVVPGLG